ncbi:MAG TPA: Lrp/AsnC family transcriptional regulator, partial [Ktedonobacteraceae bacterium]|nr:Lrp/AsnC family transcriptional regulator [Ktedonobacteraceae bacterium]
SGRDYNHAMDQQNSKTAIDEIDRKIIEALQIDGRRPFTKLAAELGISEASVRQRVASLINNRVMQIVAITNPVKLGYAMAGMIGIRVSGARLFEVVEKICAFDEVIYLIICAGSFDLLAEVVCENNDHLLHFLTEKLYKVEGVKQTETFLYLRVLKQNNWAFLDEASLLPPSIHMPGERPHRKS